MSVTKNRRIVLASRPTGEPIDENFRVEETDIPAPGKGEVLLRTIYLSLDPYMRGRMNAGPSYAPRVEVGQVMTGGTVSEVMESKAPELRAGDLVVGSAGWQQYSVAEGSALQRIDPTLAPISTALGVLGMPGMTAYTGLLNIGQPKEGETVVVSSAAGAVGSAAGQIAKIIGCRAVGVAGGKAKCEFVASQLGFDACVDYRSHKFAEELRAACPNGIDVYFENVGGHVLEAVVPLMNLFGRVPVCGLIAHYNAAGLPSGPDRVPLLMWAILVKRLTFRAFIIFDFADQQPECHNKGLRRSPEKGSVWPVG
jgi:NADPH-dependent curcumin reductase CurA